ncbi:MAG: MFS transporter [Erysipelothrix sp.]|jgi:UMF1 family MFS transporter|nr:MFS transporter [Erysipelothrix sp.]
MKFNKSELSWILYDVANSAFILIVTATIPVYFRALAESAGVETSSVTALFSTATTVAVLTLAVLSPVLGAIADYHGMKKKLFVGFLLMGLSGAASLAVVTQWQAFLVLFIIARIGYSACNVFYDSMLIDVSTDEKIDSLSSHGYAWGYIGSTIPFIVGIALILTTPFGLSAGQATQISFIITALWWGLFTIPLLKNVKQTYSLPKQPKVISSSFKRVGITFKKITENKPLFYFIIGYFLYINGVYTIMSQATNFGGEVGIDQTQMIIALLVTQFVAFPFAILAGKLATKYGALKLIKFYMLVYTLVTILGYNLSTALEFWALAIVVGMAQGGIQALSRSYFGKLIPKEESNEYFGFFDIFGKFSDGIGPLFLTAAVLLTGSARLGILGLIIFFVLGFIFINKVDKLTTTK